MTKHDTPWEAFSNDTCALSSVDLLEKTYEKIAFTEQTILHARRIIARAKPERMSSVDE